MHIKRILSFSIILLVALISSSSYIDPLKQTLVRQSHNDQVTIYRLKQDGQSYGHAIWIQRDPLRIKTTYFGFQKRENGETTPVFQQFQEWKHQEQIVLACSGAFSTELPGQPSASGIPVGLTIDRGTPVNNQLAANMDALVVVHPSGKIQVMDVEETTLWLGNKSFRFPQQKSFLIAEARQQELTIFQTQLLAFDNTLRISRTGRTKKQERRFLALVRTRSGDQYHIILDIPRNLFLFDAARDVFYFLKDQLGMSVEALLNLDTGAYNVLDIMNEQEQKDYSISGLMDIDQANNLLVYYID